ncbi:EAL domain-containing protein [Kangiella sp.]|uniref:bifunctional diguanylate cyclase/phosphodiesterase n=1 Tax=Kangiella sp. TaxID=1920245 RepID=UPI0019B51047|nr:EAL domain-containing protein [Kangiella sp.]MBD3653807.1 EAL domain-containing protein [Kangiella sp.]
MTRKAKPLPFLVKNLIAIGIIVLLGFAFLFLASRWLESTEHQYAEERFSDVSMRYLLRVTSDVERFIDDVDQLATFFSLSEKVTRFEFEHFAMSNLVKHGGVQAFEYVQVVKHDDLDAFVEMARQEYPDYSLTEKDTDGSLIPLARNREVYFPILYAFPYEENKDVLGYDAYRSEPRQEALERSIATNNTTVSPRMELHQHPGKSAALVFSPAFQYKKDGNVFRVMGFAEGVFVLEDLIQESSEELARFGLTLVITDVTDGEEVLLLEHHSRGEQQIDQENFFSIDKTFSFGGRDWNMAITGNVEEFYLPLSNARYSLILVVVLLAILLCYFMYLVFVLYRNNQVLMESKGQLRKNINELESSRNQLVYQANHDFLTDLENRFALDKFLNKLIQNKAGNKHVACLLDIDKFNLVNDSFGHEAGNFVLKQFAKVVQTNIRPQDKAYRLSADEFLVIFDSMPLESAYRVINKILETVQDTTFDWTQMRINIHASAGMASISSDTQDASEVLSELASARTIAKEKGGNRIHVFDKNDPESVHFHNQVLWVNRINKALDEDRFALRVQTIKSLDSGDDLKEVLVVMLDEEGGMIPPIEFIPAAERFNLMPKVDHWVVDRVLEYLEANPQASEFLWCVNLSGVSLNSEEFRSSLIEQISESQELAKYIVFEITETAAINNYELVKQFIDDLNDFGCKFALDDFGSGMSSYGYLRNIPVDFIKVDGSFIKQILDNDYDQTIVKSICEISVQLGIKTIAEFVENEQVLDKIKEMGFDYGQGYHIDKPKLI